MKKTLLRCLLCAAVPLLLAGCGAAQPQAAPTASPAPTPEATAAPAPTPPLPELPDAAALETLTAAYGAPGSDPFDEGGVENYVENGNLSATWTKDDVRFTLTMSRMYSDTLSFYYSYRLNYDADDLK